MFCVSMEGKTRHLFAKAFTLPDAKKKAADEFKAYPGYFVARIYDQSEAKEIERFRGEDWHEVTHNA